MELITVTSRPFLLTRWWLKTREITPSTYSDGLVGASYEFYVPFWAAPLDFLYTLVFGKAEIHK